MLLVLLVLPVRRIRRISAEIRSGSETAEIQRLAWSQRASSSASVIVERSRPCGLGLGFDDLEPRPELGARAPQRGLRVDVEVAGDVDDGEEQVTELVLDVAGDRGAIATCSSSSSSLIFGQGAVDVVPVEADRRGLALHLVRVEQRREVARDTPSMMLERPFSAFLICSQFASTSPALVDLDRAEHVRMAAHELVVDHAGDVGEREPALLRGERGVEEHLEEQVAELLLEMARPSSLDAVERVDRLERLVGLLEEMTGERAMRLLSIPRALAPQGAHELREANELVRRPERAASGIQSAVR